MSSELIRLEWRSQKLQTQAKVVCSQVDELRINGEAREEGNLIRLGGWDIQGDGGII